MNMTGNTILITGGGSGIGLALAEEFARMNDQVIVAARSPEKLKAAEQRGLATISADMSDSARRMSTARKRIGRRLADPRELSVVRMMERLGLAAHDQCGVFVIGPGVVRLDHHPDPKRQGFESFLEKRIRADPVRRHSALG